MRSVQMRIPTLILCISLAAFSQTLRIYAIDTEGGKATLYVAPSGESMLIDTGYGGNKYRDAERIDAAARAAGVERIDHLVITHYHQDHAGGVPQLAELLPIRAIYDHGDEAGTDEQAFAPYAAVRGKRKHVTLKPGGRIPVKGLDVQVVSVSGHAITKPLKGAGESNPTCSTYRAMPQDGGENSRSVALMIRFGDFRVADLGDLFWNQEYDLVCPTNLLGPVDLYMVTHHGTKTSGLPQMLYALRPRVALMNNGATKGGSADAMRIIRESPALADMWQLHWSKEGGALNAPKSLIANIDDPCKGEWIEVTAQQNGVFTLRNPRTNDSKAYQRFAIKPEA